MIKVGLETLSRLLFAREVSTQYKLRNYQQVAIDKCVDSIANGIKKIGVSLATGGGKTVIFTNLIDQLKSRTPKNEGDKFRTLILVHRRELALQTINTIKNFSHDINAQVEMGKYHCEVEQADVIVGSVQSLLNRLAKYNEKNIDLIIIDEAHHAVAKSYIKVVDTINSNGKIPVIGFSATFERNDNKALSVMFDEIVYHKGIVEMIKENWLCEGLFTSVNVDVNLDDVEVSSCNDFKLDSLSKVMNTEKINNIVVRTYLEERQKENLKSTLLFAVDVAHVKYLCEEFRKFGINAEYVTGTTKVAERDRIINDFKNFKIEVLINCGIFTEGTDIPNIDCVLLCRPTKSRSLLVQMIGRGLRLHHSKKHCHIIDFVGVENVGVVSVPTLMGIDNFNDELEAATISELNTLKLQIDKEKQEMVLKNAAVEDSLKAKYNDYLEEHNDFDLTLTSYPSFEDFCEAYKDSNGYLSLTEKEPISNTERENQYFMKSSYPWVKTANTAWAFSIHNNHHIRLYKETKEKDNVAKEIYIAKIYRELPFAMREESGIRFIPRELVKTNDFFKAAGIIEQTISEMQMRGNDDKGYTLNVNKFSPWRKLQATPKQKALLLKRLNKVNSLEKKESDRLEKKDIDNYVEHISKGEISNVLFASTIAPIYPLKRLLKVIKYRINRERIQAFQ
ncbi:hypothetical protein TPHA_0H01510 [Tetrapisispora phaffii CBS 4417]|uniref:ATP-dependent helicase IRC3 n=1 Tax=Tetrapisispora phaffii (strain ATCC 24235 / CBS 4417 / NBRC 1672 / NRRL Y-8282 / UCD 70-5) TaxID=1071381 RepID=G8BX53_TETPH|nr:hypothetical protein TPHA_0H01510 [Tetrapisispora phaffii CBS 4417]CCE64357.1 hypothetical protein TPHA_0H01510 [Tetrapisispora phaffii CBS 4417]